MLYYLSDVFGYKFLNNQLLADLYAEVGGFYVIIPDLFTGEALDEAQLTNPPAGVDVRAAFGAWKAKHNDERIEGILYKVISQIQSQYEPKFIATVGYCFTARYVVRLLAGTSPEKKQLSPDFRLNSGAIFHPSTIDTEDLKAIKSGSAFLVVAADNDDAYTTEIRASTEQILKELGEENKLKYRTVLLQGVGHGFAVRGDITIPWVKYAKERAFHDAIDWFKVSENDLA